MGAATVNAGNELPSYTVTVTDGNSSTATATHDPSVTTVNDAPTISQTTTNNFTEDSTSSGATVGVFDVNDEETADGSLTVTISDETNYAISYDGAGTATVTLTDVGAATVNAGNELPSYTVTVTDGNSSTATATHDPSVTTVNDDPTIAVSATSTLTEGSVSAGDTVHTFNIADEETADAALTLTLSNTTYYAVANNDDGTATVTLKADGVTYLNAGNSLPAYTLTVTDEANNTATATQTPTISLQNDAPTISQTTTNNFTEDSTSSGATVGVFDVNDEETADGSLTVTISDETNYAISYDGAGTATVTLTDVGAATVNAGNELPSYTVTVTDGNSSTATATHDPSVTTVNDDPTIAVSATSTLTEGSVSAGDTVHTFNIADEETADDTLTLTLSNTTYYAVANNDDGTATVTLKADGVTYLNAGNSLPAYTLTVTDEANNTATATQTPTISLQNDAPTISQTTTNNFTEDSTSSGATVGVFDVNDEETADGSLTVTISDETNYAISYDGAGTATVTLTDVGAATVNAGNELPSYTVTVTDGNSSTATATHDPSVTTVNDDPTIAVSATSTLTEGSVSAGDTVHTFNIADEETADDTLTLTLSNTTYYAVANNDDGTATVTLKADGVTYLNAGNSLPAYTLTVTDEANNTATATQTPTISLQNDAPTISQTTTNNFTEDSTSSGATVGVFDVNDEETADGSLTVTISDETNYAISYDGAGTATVTLTDVGAATVNAGNELPSYTVTVTDGNSSTATATHDPSVTTVNDAPTASNNTVSIDEDTPYVFSTSDFGYTDQDEGDTLTSVKITTLEDAGALQYYNGSAWVDVTSNQVITASDITSGYLRLNPTANESGSPYTTFEFSVNDGDADSASSYTMTINVTATNDNPVADNETNTATEGTTTTVTDGTSDILYGDTDTEGDTLEISGIRTGTESGSGTFGAIATALTGTYGSLTVNSDGTYSYTPNDVLGSGETGIDYFTYTVSDGNGGTDTGQLTITVTGANDAPVGVNDSNTIDIAATSTLTVTNDSEKDVLTNDTDPDSNDTSIVTEIRTGSTEGAGTAGTLGEALIGTYGSLIMNSNGSYTYIVNEGLKDTLDPGEIVYEYFNYTVRDGSGVTDTSSIVLKLQNGGGVVKEIREKKAERIIRNQARMEAKVQVENTFAELNQSTEFDLNNFEFEQTARKTDYSQGLKLVDLVAETDSLQISEGELSNLKVKDKQEGLKLKFGVMNEADNEIVKFDGKMSDGSALPEWIKINPKTGQTTTNIPEGVDKVEIMIIATDKNNETREIAVEIDPEKIKQDRKIIKQAKRTNSSITVNEDGTVNIVKQNEDGLVERSFNKTLNFNNQADINEIIETFKPDTILQLKPLNIGSDLIIDLPNELKGNFNNTKLVLKDGTEVPDWLEYDPVTGQIIAENPPEDVSQLELKLIIEQDGKIIVKDLEVDLQEQNVSQNFDGGENNKFVTLSDQLDKEFNDWEDYGNDLINRL